MSLINKIYNNNEIITTKEINSYVNNKIDELQKNKIEQKLLNNKFNQDAFDGFSANKSQLNLINKIRIKNFNYIFSYIFIIAIIPVIFVVTKQNTFNNFNKIKNPNNIKNASNFTKPKIKTNNIAIMPENNIKHNNISKSINLNFTHKYDYMPLIPVKKLTKLNNINVKSEITNINFKLTINFKTRYLADLKVVDYSVIKRTNNLSKNNNDIWNVAPEYENNYEKQNNSTQIKSIEFTYFNFLETALSNFKNKNYDDALFDFNIIQSQYSNDLNAIFYTALSYYYKGEFYKANTYFDKALNSNINVFYQESLWYKALTLKKINTEKSKQILQTIINEKGFYSNKAKIELSKFDE